MKNCEQILSGKVGVGKSNGLRHHLRLQHIGGSQEYGMHHNKENGRINNVGERCKYRLSNPSVILQGSCAFVVFFEKNPVQTFANVVHATER